VPLAGLFVNKLNSTTVRVGDKVVRKNGGVNRGRGEEQGKLAAAEAVSSAFLAIQVARPVKSLF